jgi:aspartate racemase
MPEKIIGIIGGMGPEATLDLYRRIIENTPAKVDQDHIHVIIDSNPKIPNRNLAIMSGGENPTDALCATARNLEKAGADFLIMPCNSAHMFLKEFKDCVNIPILSIVDETVRALLKLIPNVKAVGLLATPAVVRTRLYADPLQAHGITTLTPNEESQKEVYAVISSVKAGDKSASVRACLKNEAEDLVSRGAQAILLACTELPLVMSSGDLNVPVLDTIDVLARAAIREVRGSHRSSI